MKFQFRVLMFVVFGIIVAACSAPAPASTAPTPTPDWPTYSNPQAGFSIHYPSTWKVETLPDQNSGALHGLSLKGSEGGVEIYWGVGLGGACPEGFQTIKAAQGELPACYGKAADGTERWENISKNLANASFSARAYTSDAAPSSHDLVLKVVSTLSFP